MLMPLTRASALAGFAGLIVPALLIGQGCQVMDWFDPAALPPSPAADSGALLKVCQVKGSRVCVSCALAYHLNGQTDIFRVAAKPSIALAAVDKGYALFFEADSRRVSSGLANTRIDHVRLAADGTVRPATSLVPADWKSTTPPGDVNGDSRYPAAAGNGSTAAVVWQDHYCMGQEAMFARFSPTGANLQGQPFGDSQYIYMDRIRKASVTTYCHPGAGGGWAICGWARSPALVHAGGDRYGVAAHVTAHKGGCSSSPCAALLGCKHPNYFQTHLFLVQASPWQTPTPLRVSAGDGDAKWATVAWSGTEFGLAWSDWRHGSSEIYFRRARADASATVGPEVRVTNAPFDSLKPVLQWHGNGYGLAWHDERLMTSQIYFASLDASGQLASSKPLSITGGTSGAWNPSLAWDGNRYGLAWEDGRDNQLEVYFTLMDASGGVLSSEIRVSEALRNSSFSPQAYAPRIVAGPGGEFGLAWIGNMSFTDTNNKLRQKTEIYFARISCL